MEEAPIEEEEPEAPEEVTPTDEALEQYRTIVGQADSYDYGEYAEANQAWLELAGYRYALVQMRSNDPVPTLLLKKEIMDTETSVASGYVRIFQYDPDTKTLHQPAEVISDSGIRGGLSMSGDGEGIMSTYWSGGTGEGAVTQITLDGDSINQDTYWSGQIFEMPDSITFIDIEWHEIGDLSALDSWTEPALSEMETQSENESTSLLSDYVGIYTPYAIFSDYYGGGEQLRDITLMESGMVTGGGTSWNVIGCNGLEPSEIFENEDGSIEITFSGTDEVYIVYPAGVVPPDNPSSHYSSDDYWQRELDPGKVHILYLVGDGIEKEIMEILYHN